MDQIDNNQFEVVPAKSKRKIIPSCPNVYLNPALDLLANEDPMCNTAMEVPVKKRKRTKSCDIVTFENSALDLGISKAAVNEFLARELDNVKKNVRFDSVANTADLKPKYNLSDPNINFTITKELDFEEEEENRASNISINNMNSLGIPTDNDIDVNIDNIEPIYANLTEIVTPNEATMDTVDTNNGTDQNEASTLANNVEPNNDMSIVPTETDVDVSMSLDCGEAAKCDTVTDSGISIPEHKSLCKNELLNNDISAINATNIQTNVTNQIFVNNTSNLSLSFIDRLALDSPNGSLVLDDDLNESNIMEIKTITIITKKKRIEKKKNTNPFLDPNFAQKLEESEVSAENPFLNATEATEMEYSEDVSKPIETTSVVGNRLMPKRLFVGDINSTMSTVNESTDQPEYENIDGYRPESPIYENVCEMYENNINKQSKILGHDVSQFSAVDIMNLNKNSQGNCSNESNDSKKKNQMWKPSTLSKKVLKKLKKTFKGDKHGAVEHNATLNPYEIPRKLPKEKQIPKGSGIENPALFLDTSDIEIEELEDEDEEHQYETIKTLRNTRLNMNVTPLRERNTEADVSHNKTSTPGKKVRFDSTLNKEKVITGNSFDYGIQSPGFDAKIDKYHDELENCINEKKFLQQNM